MGREQTICEQIEIIKNTICDEYCKYPYMDIPEGKEEDWFITDDDSPCNNCPLMLL